MNLSWRALLSVPRRVFEPRDEWHLLRRAAARGRIEDLSGTDSARRLRRAALERTVAFLRSRLDEALESRAQLERRNVAISDELHTLRAERDALRELHVHAVDPDPSRPYVRDLVAAAEYEIDREIGTFTVGPRPPFGFIPPMGEQG